MKEFDVRIGELAKSSGFSIDTLRWYDKIGLVRPTRRNPNSRFREYGEGALDMLTLVKLAKVAGLSLPQIKKILAAAQRGSACEQVVPLLDERIEEIDGATRALQDLRWRLARALKNGFLKKQKAAGCTCPILAELGKDRGKA